MSLALVANYGDPTFAGEGLTVYQANSVTGTLTLLPQLFPTAPMGQPDGAAFSPLLLSGKLLAAAANFNTNGINGVNTYLVTLPPTITLAALRGKRRTVLMGTISSSTSTFSSTTGPFLLYWSDGVVEVVYSTTFSRIVRPKTVTLYQVTSLAQQTFAICPSNPIIVIPSSCSCKSRKDTK